MSIKYISIASDRKSFNKNMEELDDFLHILVKENLLLFFGKHFIVLLKTTIQNRKLNLAERSTQIHTCNGMNFFSNIIQHTAMKNVAFKLFNNQHAINVNN